MKNEKEMERVKLEWFKKYYLDLEEKIEKEKKRLCDEYREQGYKDSELETEVQCLNPLGTKYIITVYVYDRLTGTSKWETIAEYSDKGWKDSGHFLLTHALNTREENLRILESQREWKEIIRIEEDEKEKERLMKENERLVRELEELREKYEKEEEKEEEEEE